MLISKILNIVKRLNVIYYSKNPKSTDFINFTNFTFYRLSVIENCSKDKDYNILADL